MKKKPINNYHISDTYLNFEHQNQIFKSLQTQIGPRQKVIISVSGGSDSILTAVLVYNFFITNKYNLQNLFFIHFNHKIREESNQEEIFIKNFFKSNNLICISAPKPFSDPTEDFLRQRRYDHIKQTCNQNKIKILILGHNLSDRIESSFMNILRGASLKGFLSMQDFQDHHLLPHIKIIRPLINISKSKIQKTCLNNNIPFVTDQSNFDSSVSLRNKLRNDILPLLHQLGNTDQSFENSMLNIYISIQDLLARKSSKNHNDNKSNKNRLLTIHTSPHWKSKFAYMYDISTSQINNLDILDILKQLKIYQNTSSARTNELVNFLKTSSDGYKYFNKTYFFVSHGKIYIIQAQTNFWTTTPALQSKIKDKPIKFDNFIIRPQEEIIGCTIRYPKLGDKYKNKTINQYFINQKIPIFWRNFVPIIEKDGEIIKVIKPITH